jgi:hypothetical protein
MNALFFHNRYYLVLFYFISGLNNSKPRFLYEVLLELRTEVQESLILLKDITILLMIIEIILSPISP